MPKPVNKDISKKRSNENSALRAHRVCPKRQASTKTRTLLSSSNNGQLQEIRSEVQGTSGVALVRHISGTGPRGGRIFVRFLHAECSLYLQSNLFRTRKNPHLIALSKELEGFIGSVGSPAFGRALACFVFCGMTVGGD